MGAKEKTELIEKINTLRDWKRIGQLKTSKGRNPDDLDTLLNQMEILVNKKLNKE